MKAIGIAAVILVILFASRLSYAGETVRVGVYENSPKVSCNKSGKPAGFFIDILEYIAQKEGWTLEYVPGAWPECLTRLDREDIDLLVDIARTPERSQRYDFIKTSVLSDWVRLYRRPGLSINEWPDLQGKTIAVLKGSLQHGILVETLDKFGVQCNIKAVSTQKEVFQLLNDDDVDAGIVNRFFGCEYENDYTVERTPIIFAATDACFAMPKGHKPHLGEAIDRHLAEMKRNPDSYYYKILNTWLERYEHQKHGGIPRWIFISLAALLGGVALLVANIAFLKSTVRRRTAELKTSMESLQESEARYRALFEGAAEGILVADIETKKFIYANPAICRMLGYTQEELVALGITDIHPAESPERIIAHFESNDDKQLIPDIPCLRKDGCVIYADITKAPAVVDGRKCKVGFFTDVTQRKKLEEQFNQAQKLEAVGQLAGGVAHDFNNILTAQIGYCDLMKRRLRDEDPLAADLAQVKICAERAATLTRQLLAFSRKQTLEPKVLNLNDIVTNIEKMLRRLIGEHIEFVTVLADGLGSVKADPARIEQVIMNLAVNARDAMPQGGRLTIETANVVLDENYAQDHIGATAGPHVMLAITDNGCGMDEQTRRRLFEPFFTTKGVGKGTGLGLATVYGIVKQSGGNIWVYSELDKGTTFKIFLPRVEAAPTRPAEKEIEAARGKGELILVVEDEPVLRELFTRMIENLGYRVKIAANGIEALQMIEQEGLKPDLLITDVVMPKMGGKELVERVSRIQPGLKTLYTSGHASGSFINYTGLDPGAPFLQKPFSSDELAAKIQWLIRPKD